MKVRLVGKLGERAVTDITDERTAGNAVTYRNCHLRAVEVRVDRGDSTVMADLNGLAEEWVGVNLGHHASLGGVDLTALVG